jgi:hypothetical protein
MLESIVRSPSNTAASNSISRTAFPGNLLNASTWRNYGDNPVATIDSYATSLRRWWPAETHDLVSQLAEEVNQIEVSLKNGSYKSADVPLSMFESRTAKSGHGGDCVNCQGRQ